jgi:hypothetical protein
MSANSLLAIVVVGAVAYGVLTSATNKIIPDDPFDEKGRKKNIGQRLVGQSCAENSDCSMRLIVPSEEGGSRTSAIGCCNNTCQVRNQDGLFGAYTCREKNDAIPEIEQMARYYYYGDKNNEYEYPNTKEVNQSCTKNSDCGYYGMPHSKPADGSVSGCNNGQCQMKRKDWAGNLYYPDKCKGAIDLPPGTCNRNDLQTPEERIYRQYWASGRIENVAYQPKYKPSLTKEEIEKYFK